MLFSILMCTYNSAKTLKNAIESLEMQTCRDWELIIIDNGSEDDTAKIIENYQQYDPRIVCEYKDYNVGWYKGISECLKMATGEYMMFLAADDIIVSQDTLKNVECEINNNSKPDIIWTGCCFANFNNGQYELLSQIVPEYKSFQPDSLEERLQQIVYIMQNVYYNSVMHYVNINFLKKNNIDFFSPYEGDNCGMTEAMCLAENMVVIDKPEYLLTINTSQTSLAVIFDSNLALQWQSIKKTFKTILYDERYTYNFKYIAKRIANNMAGILNSIIGGNKLRNIYMNPIDIDFSERFLKTEMWLSDPDFGEMLNFAGRKDYINKILCTSAVILYKNIVTDKNLMEKTYDKSKWLLQLIVRLFAFDDKITIKNELSQAERNEIKDIVFNEYNVNQIGMEFI